MNFNVFIITDSIFSNKYKKRVILINLARSPPLYKRDLDWSSVYSSKMGEGTFFSKKGEIGKIVDPKKITTQGIDINVTSFNIYPDF